MIDDSRMTGRSAVAGLGLALVTASAAFGALLGATLPARTGLEEIAVLSVAIPVSPVSLAVYGAVATSALLASLWVAIVVLSRFDEDAVER
ncbi:hypothetical protein HYG81_17125 [Natrinema zhouii]|uniref:Cox cluster protein n=1 Tax=Natrinema zhouii TaxID=1710539 RepID=A0A7D6CNC5_9EURY|nr:hypothetical protein [Natrinema zhouii]QLK25778.1 hypothetical protein HYG81_17125 [Natrinema zhouii]